jgi:hypothetical protein
MSLPDKIAVIRKDGFIQVGNHIEIANDKRTHPIILYTYWGYISFKLEDIKEIKALK